MTTHKICVREHSVRLCCVKGRENGNDDKKETKCGNPLLYLMMIGRFLRNKSACQKQTPCDPLPPVLNGHLLQIKIKNQWKEL